MIVFCHFLPVGQMESGAQNEMTKFAKQLLLKYTFQYHCSYVSHLMAIVNISIYLKLDISNIFCLPRELEKGLHLPTKLLLDNN